MKNIAYDHRAIYSEDDDYTVPGRILNEISAVILAMEEEINNLKDAELKKELEELRIRDKNPAVKDAWDQYQTVLKLARKNDE